MAQNLGIMFKQRSSSFDFHSHSISISHKTEIELKQKADVIHLKVDTWHGSEKMRVLMWWMELM